MRSVEPSPSLSLIGFKPASPEVPAGIALAGELSARMTGGGPWTPPLKMVR
jgi:hypothetical protein